MIKKASSCEHAELQAQSLLRCYCTSISLNHKSPNTFISNCLISLNQRNRYWMYPANSLAQSGSMIIPAMTSSANTNEYILYCFVLSLLSPLYVF